ncbi:hypothetical protein AALA13_02975 [Lachnospiraceae bacterium 50-23]
MEAVKSTIENVIDAVFPSKYLDYVFGRKIEPEEVDLQILNMLITQFRISTPFGTIFSIKEYQKMIQGWWFSVQ